MLSYKHLWNGLNILFLSRKDRLESICIFKIQTTRDQNTNNKRSKYKHKQHIYKQKTPPNTPYIAIATTLVMRDVVHLYY